MMAGRGGGQPSADGGLARHIPVLGGPAVDFLNVREGGVYVDATFGAGGYTRAILAAANCNVIGIDRDQHAVAAGFDLVSQAQGRLVLVEDRFSNLEGVARSCGYARRTDVRRYSWRTFTRELALLGLAVAFCVPFYLLFVLSVKPSLELFTSPMSFPTDPAFGNYEAAWNQSTRISMGRAMLNSLIITVGTVIGHIGETEVRSAFEGVLQSYIAVSGERVTHRQPIAWLRTI